MSDKHEVHGWNAGCKSHTWTFYSSQLFTTTAAVHVLWCRNWQTWRAKLFALQWWIPSSTLFILIIGSTGPNGSSQAIRISGSTLSIRTGQMRLPSLFHSCISANLHTRFTSHNQNFYRWLNSFWMQGTTFVSSSTSQWAIFLWTPLWNLKKGILGKVETCAKMFDSINIMSLHETTSKHWHIKMKSGNILGLIYLYAHPAILEGGLRVGLHLMELSTFLLGIFYKTLNEISWRFTDHRGDVTVFLRHANSKLLNFLINFFHQFIRNWLHHTNHLHSSAPLSTACNHPYKQYNEHIMHLPVEWSFLTDRWTW